MIRDKLYEILASRLREPRRFIQAVIGPRQVGKTTLVRQVLEDLEIPCHYVSADEPGLQDQHWLEQQWELARMLARQHAEAVLVIDEIQKVAEWSSIVKKCWDADTADQLTLKVVILGSSPLLLQEGLTESLAGRFETIPVRHWSFAEMREAFDFTLEQYIYFGGYPGAAPLITDETRWRSYINDSLIETTISRDILLMNRINKPALLRRLFQLGCRYSSQILSLQNMLGQLQEAGNATTLSHYLNLLSGAGMLHGLQKFSQKEVRHRASSPKLQVLNTALFSAQQTLGLQSARADTALWGHLVESSIGAYIINEAIAQNISVYYWREQKYEIDFVLQQGSVIIGIEVKSGKRNEKLPGMKKFQELFKPQRTLLVGASGLSIEEFLLTPLTQWFFSKP